MKNNSVIILDYAHTPIALETAILNVKEEFPLSKISLVFGCGGNRDKNKRSIMGAIAKKYCEKILLNSNNPKNSNFFSVRFGNVINSSGSVIPIFKNQIEKNY